MGKRYSKRELQALVEIEKEFGQVTYSVPIMLEDAFFNKTGNHRPSGCLYMCLWRIKRGDYDGILYSGTRRVYEKQKNLI